MTLALALVTPGTGFYRVFDHGGRPFFIRSLGPVTAEGAGLILLCLFHTSL
jgi:hypothetical protein